MRHGVFGRKLSRTANQRQRLFAVLVRDLFLHNAIVTTIPKAKAVQPIVEKLITKAKEGSENARRRVFGLIGDRQIVKALFEDAKTRFAGRNSGYTRIIKVGRRLGDATETAMLSFVDEKVLVEVVKSKAADAKTETPKAAVKETTEKPVKEPVKKTVKKTTKKV